MTESIRTICVLNVPSCALTSNLKENLLKMLKEKEATCEKQLGYIKTVSQDFVIKRAIVARNDSLNEFVVEFSVERFKPKLGVEYRARIDGILDVGLLVVFENVSRALICGGERKNDCYHFNKCGCKFVVGDSLSIILDAIDFKNNQFRSSGTHIHRPIQNEFDYLPN